MRSRTSLARPGSGRGRRRSGRGEVSSRSGPGCMRSRPIAASTIRAQHGEAKGALRDLASRVPADRSLDARTSTGIGNLASHAVLTSRHHDGSNQLGDEPGGTPGVAYSDYTGFVPVNTPMDIRFAFEPSSVSDPNLWQPLRYIDGTGAVVTPR